MERAPRRQERGQDGDAHHQHRHAQKGGRVERLDFEQHAPTRREPARPRARPRPANFTPLPNTIPRMSLDPPPNPQLVHALFDGERHQPVRRSVRGRAAKALTEWRTSIHTAERSGTLAEEPRASASSPRRSVAARRPTAHHCRTQNTAPPQTPRSERAARR